MFCAPYFGWFLGYDYNIHLAGLLAVLHIIWALNKRVRRSIKLLQHILLFFTAELDLFFYYINLSSRMAGEREGMPGVSSEEDGSHCWDF